MIDEAGAGTEAAATTPNADAGGLVMAALTAGFAPSIHNTQPWRWRVSGTTLELWAVRERQLPITDPAGRLLTVSCGAALHHARIALAAEGWQVRVDRLTDPGHRDLLASVTVAQPAEPTRSAIRLLQTARVRHTDRRAVADTPVDRGAVDHLGQVADREGARMHVLSREDVVELAGAARRAEDVEGMDEAWVEELAYWAGGERDGGLGMPDTVIPSASVPATVPERHFPRAGTLPTGAGDDREAVYAIIYGDDDTSLDWLRAGEAVSAVWLQALQRGLTVLPLSAAVEVHETRTTLQHLLPKPGYPFLILRIGVPPGHEEPPVTPRLPAEQTIEIIS